MSVGSVIAAIFLILFAALLIAAFCKLDALEREREEQEVNHDDSAATREVHSAEMRSSRNDD